MKRLLSLLTLMALAAALCVPAAAADSPPDALSAAYAVMDAATGQLLYGKNAQERVYPASVTKVLTVALVLSEHAPEETFVLGGEVLDIEPGSTHAALSPGEEVTVDQMCYAAMVPSANDASNALAVYNAGSMEKFVEKMNAKARELGAVSSRFANPSGLDHPEHYTTPHDFALITRWATTVPNFMKYYGAPEYTMAPTNIFPEERYWGTHNCLIVRSSFTYPGATGGKDGYTHNARQTFVASAERDGLGLIVTEFGSAKKYDRFKDAVALFDFGFARYQNVLYTVPELGDVGMIPYIQGGEQSGFVMLDIPKDVALTLPKGALASQVTARLHVPSRYEEGAEIAPTMSFDYGGKTVYTRPLAYSIREDGLKEQDGRGDKNAFALSFEFSWLKFLLITAAAAAILFLVIVIRREIVLTRRRRRRRALRNSRYQQSGRR